MIADYFQERGYERLDASAFSAFLEARIDDGLPSVVVVGMDGVPADAIQGDTPLVRRYLDAGGKLVWMGYLPGQLVYNENDDIANIDHVRPGEILGVDFTSYDGDHYTVTPTEAGRRWGLESWWVGIAQTLPDQVDEVLALNELGRVVSWVKRYGGSSGVGFVSVYPTWDRKRLAEIQRVAEHGLGQGR